MHVPNLFIRNLLENIFSFNLVKTGFWIGLPGCDKEFDDIANDFSKKSEEDRKKAIKKIKSLIEDKDIEEERVKIARKYLKIMNNIQSQGSNFVSEEIMRLENLLDTRKKIALSNRNNLQQNLNILKSFHISGGENDKTKDEL